MPRIKNIKNQKKESKKVKKRGFERYLTLDWKEVYLLIVTWFLFLVLHNMYPSIFGKEDKILFIIATIIIPAFFLIALAYTYFKKRG